MGYFQGYARMEQNTTLATELQWDFLQQLRILQDLNSNIMLRQEVIGVIQPMTGASFQKTEQHCYYCQRQKLFPDLKGHGALRIEQVTIMKRSGVMTDKLMR